MRQLLRGLLWLETKKPKPFLFQKLYSFLEEMQTFESFTFDD